MNIMTCYDTQMLSVICFTQIILLQMILDIQIHFCPYFPPVFNIIQLNVTKLFVILKNDSYFLIKVEISSVLSKYFSLI